MRRLRFRRLLLLSTLALLLLPVSANSLPERESGGKRWALIIGVDNYLCEFPALTSAVNEAVRLKHTLIDYNGFPEDNVYLFTTNDHGNWLPTRVNISRCLSHIRSCATSNDVLIFFFSGHCVEKDAESYLITCESQPKNEVTLEESSINLSFLKEQLSEVPAGEKMILIDAFHGASSLQNSGIESSLSERKAQALIVQHPASNEGFAVTFFPCGYGQQNHEWSREKLGFFTYFLLKWLRGEGGKEMNTLGSLAEFVAKEVPEAVRKEKGSLVRQQPWVAGDLPAGSDFIFPRRSFFATENSRSPAKVPSITEKFFAGTKPTPHQQADFHIARGNDHMEGASYEKAIDEYSQAISRESDYPLCYFNRAIAYEEKQDYDRAISDYNKLLELSPHFSPGYYGRGNAHFLKGDLDKAESDCSKALSINGNLYPAYFLRGIIFRKKGEYGKSIADFNSAISIVPDSASLLYHRGNTYGVKREYEKAISDYTKALRLDPGFTNALINRGLSFYNLGEYDKAIADHTQAMDSNSQDALYNRGLAYLRKGDLKGAVSDFTGAISINPKDTDAYLSRGNAYQDMGDFDNALKDYTTVISLEANNTRAYVGRGNVHTNKKEFEKAIYDYTKAIEINPLDPYTYYNRGNACYNRGDYEKALADLRKFIEIAPKGSENWIKEAEAMISEIERILFDTQKERNP